jgi:DNA polymerase-3 subunit alpha (Gram-positive type)
MYKDEEFFSTRLEEELAYIKEKGKSYELRIIGAIFDFSDIRNYPVIWQRGALPKCSLVLYLLGFSNKNPLPPHYICPKCRLVEAVDARNYAHGFDLPDKKCSVCDIMMIKDGHDIKFDLAGYKWEEYPAVLGINKSIVKGLQKHIDYLFGTYSTMHTTVECIHLQNEVKCTKCVKNPLVSRWYECRYFK